MKNRSEPPDERSALQEKLAGLGEYSLRKTYYPELQQRVEELERFKAFIDHSNDAIFLVKVPTGRIVDVNGSASRQMGWSREEILEISIFDLSDLETSPLAVNLIKTPLNCDSENGLVVTELRKKGNQRFPAELTLNRMYFQNVAYVLVVARDITERRHGEEALRQSEVFLKSIVENIPDMVFVKDAVDLRYVEFNSAGEDLLGYSREEMLGKNDYDFFPDEQVAFFIKKDREVFAKGELVEIPEENVKTRDGSVRILHTKKIPLFDSKGKAQYLLGISEDITDRKHLEEQLLQSQKMDAIGQLAGGVAHDFNNILMVIMGYADVLKMDETLDQNQKYKVEQVLSAAERAAQLTRSLLTFSRKQVMTKRIANLNDLVQQIQEFLVRIIGEDVLLKSVLHEEALLVFIDSGQIEQVLINLATNARDAMPKGGLLTIETGLQFVDSLFVQANNCGEPGHYATIAVSDTGIGMDENTRNKIFEPFFTTKEFGKGTGLGMSIVYGIVKQHNGFVNVYSEPLNGTTFRIYLPIVGGKLSMVEEVTIPSPPRGSGETILVVEDEPAVRKLVKEILESYGYTVITAEDGEGAVEMFVTHRESVKLILMDIVMPRMSGKKAYDVIRKLDGNIKALFTSGYPMDIINSRDAMDEGVELILKPIQPFDLLRRVREMLDR